MSFETLVRITTRPDARLPPHAGCAALRPRLWPSLLAEVEGVEQIIRSRIARRERRQVPAPFDEAKDRDGLVRGAVHEPALGIGRDDEGRHTPARSPTVDDRRRDVVPEAVPLVVGNDNGAALPVGALHHGLHKASRVRIALLETGRAGGVLVIIWLDEGHVRQRAVLKRGDTVRLSLQMHLSRPGPGRNIGKVLKGVVHELALTAPIPRPRDTGSIEPVPDVRHRLQWKL